MAKLFKIAYIFSLRGKFYFENLLVSENTAQKSSTRRKYVFFYQLSVKFRGFAIIRGVGEKIENLLIDPAYN